MLLTPSIVCAGELLWDLLPSGPRLGGATTNFSVLSARLGASAILVSRVGRDDLGRTAVAHLESCKPAQGSAGSLDLSRIQMSNDLPTGTVDVTLDSEGMPAYTIEQPVAWDQIELEDELLEVAAGASAVYFGTLAQRQHPSRRSIRTVVEATPPGCTRVCDVNLRQPFCTAETLGWCLQHATVLKVSDEELPEIFRLLRLALTAEAGDHGADQEEPLPAIDPRSAASVLLANAPHCDLVAITLGPRGSYLANRGAEHRHMGFPIKVVDTIGAGDAFTAGMVYAYLRGGTLEQINTISNLCGSYVASQPGATPEFATELLEKLRSLVDDGTKAAVS